MNLSSYCNPFYWNDHLQINTKEGNLTANETEQSKIIAEHFKNLFYKTDVNVTEYEATPMRDPFISDEIQKAVNKLKNNKSAGIDKIKAEMLKNAPETIIIEIAEILKNIAETGNYRQRNHGRSNNSSAKARKI